MQKHYDVVIVGTGVAGMYCALQFPENIKVLLVAKKDFSLSNSSLAQGGIAAVLNPEHDDFKLHIADTLIAGKYKNKLSAIEVLVTQGPKDVLALRDLGVDFDSDKDGKLLMTLEAGHSRNRIVHHKDYTGSEITSKLIEKVKSHNNIDMISNTTVFNLEKTENGFYVNMIIDNEIKTVYTNYCVLATGGIGRVYEYTTNSAIATGDGITLAYELGANIKGLSCVQFHPTAFASQSDRERFLISEAVRGEGAILVNDNGEEFAYKYDERGHLAPRDVVSDAIMKEINSTGNNKFYLDIRHKDADFVKDRFPMIYKKCLEEGIDITKDKIPVFPCQHYLMGGIEVDLKAKTTIDRLYAVGECANTGVHGANRLASNSLLEALVFSRIASEDIMNRIKSNKELKDKSNDINFKIYKNTEKSMPSGKRTQVREIMQNTHFVVSNKEKLPLQLDKAESILNDLKSKDYKITTDYVEAKSLATICCIMLKELMQEEEK